MCVRATRVRDRDAVYVSAVCVRATRERDAECDAECVRACVCPDRRIRLVFRS